jgi:alanine racemase
VEIDAAAAANNLKVIRGFSGVGKIYATVKSNAYGHGLAVFGKLMEKEGIDGFCVDTVPEGLYLREEGIKKPILVIGYSLPEEWENAEKNGISVTVSNMSALKKVCGPGMSPRFHLKVDTGMRRQGILPEEYEEAASVIAASGKDPEGLFTHFASPEDIGYPGFTDKQFFLYEQAAKALDDRGVKGFMRHSAATGGLLVGAGYKLDMARIGIGLYGYFPSKELEAQFKDVGLRPVLTWKSIISEVKKAQKGDHVGYDLTEKLDSDTSIAVVPVGYWHGLPRNLSRVTEVKVNGKKCRILGLVSMDMIVIDIGDGNFKEGDEVIIMDDAYYFARNSGSSHYEVLTRINPAIKRILV